MQYFVALRFFYRNLPSPWGENARADVFFWKLFFIRDYEYGEKIETVPYEPIREGYTFAGWYKEPKCVNAWDFERDTLPTATYNEEGYVTNHIVTHLYAKWIKE